MKTKIITAVAGVLLFNLTAFSIGHENTSATVSRDVALNGNFRQVSVSENVKLVLVPGDQKTSVTIAGAEDLVSQVSVTITKNEMRISSKKTLKQGGVVVYVPAKDISQIWLSPGSSVSAQGFLNSNYLTVFLSVGSRVDLKSLGEINIKEAPGCEFVYDRYEKAKVINIAQ